MDSQCRPHLWVTCTPERFDLSLARSHKMSRKFEALLLEEVLWSSAHFLLVWRHWKTLNFKVCVKYSVSVLPCCVYQSDTSTKQSVALELIYYHQVPPWHICTLFSNHQWQNPYCCFCKKLFLADPADMMSLRCLWELSALRLSGCYNINKWKKKKYLPQRLYQI